MADPWTERNYTKKGRDIAEAEQEIKRGIEQAKKQGKFPPQKFPPQMRDPTAPLSREKSHPKPRPFWDPC